MSFKNLLQFKKRMEKRVVANPLDNAEDLIARATRMVSNRAQESIARDPKTGVMRPSGSPASAAGEPPAADTGFFISRISYKIDRSRDEVVGTVRVSAPYAAPLEFGTTNIAPRPFMQPALESNRPRIRKMYKEGGLIK